MIPTITLKNGVAMPMLGLGTSQMKGEEAYLSVRAALEMGYRLIDTAKMYGNEESVGKAVRESSINREDIFLTTKLWPADFFNPQKAFDESMARLGLGYIDLYLIHWPIPLIPKSLWRAMEKVYESKKVRAIGISNYRISDIRKVLAYAQVPPMVNQIKFSPFDFNKELLEFCHENKIAVEAYSPLTRGHHLHDERIEHIAKRYDKTPAQILLRWCIQHRTIPIPKTSRPERMRENKEVFEFELKSEDMQTLNALG